MFKKIFQTNVPSFPLELTCPILKGVTKALTLLVQLRGQSLRRVPLEQECITLGRLPGNDVVLPLPPTSRSHLEIRREANTLWITDLGSDTGSFVEGIRLMAHQPYPWLSGVALQVGPYVLTYTDALDIPEALPPLPELSDTLPSSELVLAPPRLSHSSFPGGALEPYTPPSAPNGDALYLRYLPVIFHESDFMSRFLQIFEAVWEPLEWRQDHLPMYFDPDTAPEPFLNWLSTWFGLSWNPRWPESRRRKLLSESLELYRWRGTRYGLSRLLEICTGHTPEILEEATRPQVFRVRFAGVDSETFPWTLAEELIQSHKPAHSGYVLEIDLLEMGESATH